MNPVTVWTFVAVLGIAVDLWNVGWAIADLRRAKAANGSVLRPAREALAKHNLGTEVIQLVAQGAFLYLGVKFWGQPAAWGDFTTALVLGASGFTLNAIRGAVIRKRLELMRRRIEAELAG